ncbi:hypothetical protein HanIR_Chr08g0349101 [Helianthus annuus]|nr:hypothetical protein HanIR_Chr08g0349101 [Helianthus annuus]
MACMTIVGCVLLPSFSKIVQTDCTDRYLIDISPIFPISVPFFLVIPFFFLLIAD